MPLFFSDPSTGPRRQELAAGKAHYSYAFPCQRILELFGSARPVHLPRPEIISSGAARRALEVGDHVSSAHLIFRPFEQIRILKGAFNIAHVPWEFNHFIDEPPERYPHPFHSQRQMLRACDEVWTGSSHAVTVYGEHGVESVKRVPSPVPCAAELPVRAKRGESLARLAHLPSLTLSISFGSNNIPRHERAIKPLGEQPALQELEGRRIYVSVFNPGDFRKNAEKILRGFATFADEHPEAVLIVKLVIDNQRPTLAMAQQNTLLPKFKEETLVRSDNVMFISAFLDEADMGRFYELSDYYVCLSVGEGQNLPLCEAMAFGVVPISVAHTAMADYIDRSVAVVVPSTRTWLALAEASRWSIEGRVDGFDCSEQDYLSALEESLALSSAGLEALSEAAHRRALEQFSPAAVAQLISEQSAFDFREYL